MGAEVMVIGEALVDIIVRPGRGDDEYPGGSPANVALGLGRLERSVRLLPALGDDDRGRRVRGWLGDSDVEVDAHPLARTATARATLAADGSAQYDFDLVWDIASLSIDDAPRVVHIGSLSALREPGAGRVRELIDGLGDDIVVTYDPNIRPSLIPPREESRALVEDWVRRSTLVKVSDEDLAWLYPAEPAREVAERWAGLGPESVVLTRGGEGVEVFGPGDRVREYPAPRVEVSDTVGAGDSLMAALVDATLSASPAAWDLDEVAERALRIAAITVSRPGADPPRRSELDH